MSELDAKIAALEGHAPGLQYSTVWGDGGPIIEREKIAIMPKLINGDWYGDWRAVCLSFEGRTHADRESSTPLMAAMLAYVDSRSPDELP